MISIVCPFYNEEQTVGALFSRLIPALDRLGESYEVVCVNDGSRDGTLEALLAMRAMRPHVRVIDLSRNFGKEAALTAGIDAARGDAVIPIDADLQDTPELIARLVREWKRGFEVVLAKRADRRADSLAKRLAGSGVHVHAAAPGFVKTDFNQNVTGFTATMINLSAKLFADTPAQGGDAITWVAIAPELEGQTGKYFDRRKEKEGKFSDPAAIAALEGKLQQMAQ